MAINVKKKSACVRFGPRYKNVSANVVVSGALINWVTSSRYLGVHLESCGKFKCSFVSNESKFYMAFNSLFGKIGRNAPEEVLFALNVCQFCCMVLKHVRRTQQINN